MKIRFLFTFVVSIFLLNQAPAQFAIKTKMLGLNFGYSSISKSVTAKETTDKTILNPTVYYFVSDHYALGAGFISISENKYYTVNNIDFQEELNTKGVSIGTKLFTKGEHTFKFYVNPTLMILSVNGLNHKDRALVSTVKGNSGGFILGSGFIYMLNKKMGLDLSTGPILSFLGTEVTTSQPNAKPLSDVNTEFQIMPNGLSNLTVGFNYFF